MSTNIKSGEQLVNFNHIANQLKGQSVPKPLSGTLSGHAAGEPFDKHVYCAIKAVAPERTFRQFEYLNELYSKNAACDTWSKRHELIKSQTMRYLLNRGKTATNDWSNENTFEEKQNDTADIILKLEDKFILVDVKTINTSKKAQPPNIISALKLAKMCKLMLEHNEFNVHEIIYFEVQWRLNNQYLECTQCTEKYLFKTRPENLYVNWAAALQIQFHVGQLAQDFNGTQKEWCQQYLTMFTTQAKRRIDKMKTEYVDEYLPLIN